MRLESNQTSFRPVEPGYYAEPVEVKREVPIVFHSPFPEITVVGGRGGGTRYKGKAMARKCKGCNRLSACNGNGLCLKCVVDAMPRIQAECEVVE